MHQKKCVVLDILRSANDKFGVSIGFVDGFDQIGFGVLAVAVNGSLLFGFRGRLVAVVRQIVETFYSVV